jgi:GNAT superfamily N-acetyltransferase
MSLYQRYRIEDISFLQVAAIVTDENVRGQGFGRKLMAHAEKRAKEKNLAFVGLHSSFPRTKTHQFYQSLGYHKNKESYFFKKEIL